LTYGQKRQLNDVLGWECVVYFYIWT